MKKPQITKPNNDEYITEEEADAMLRPYLMKIA